jgi:hypothetical protein
MPWCEAPYGDTLPGKQIYIPQISEKKDKFYFPFKTFLSCDILWQPLGFRRSQ